MFVCRLLLLLLTMLLLTMLLLLRLSAWLRRRWWCRRGGHVRYLMVKGRIVITIVSALRGDIHGRVPRKHGASQVNAEVILKVEHRKLLQNVTNN
jgi:hypothetical protein